MNCYMCYCLFVDSKIIPLAPSVAFFFSHPAAPVISRKKEEGEASKE